MGASLILCGLMEEMHRLMSAVTAPQALRSWSELEWAGAVGERLANEEVPFRQKMVGVAITAMRAIEAHDERETLPAPYLPSLRVAFDRNVVVYDRQAKCGDFTDQLLVMMAANAGFVIRRFVSSYGVAIQGFPYEVDPELNTHYRALGGTLPCDKIDTLLAIGQGEGEALLGAF